MNKGIELASYIDETLLRPETTAEEIASFCREARRYSFVAVCVNPIYVKSASRHLRGSEIRVCAVVGFPLGATTAAVKAFEAAEAVAGGASEIDMVIHIGSLKAGRTEYVEEEIAAVVRAASGCPVKVILETGLLTDEEKIAGCRAAKRGGAQFVKTSTGFGPGGATVDDVRLLKEAVGPEMGVKASGGVRTRESALEMIAAGASRIGTSSGAALAGRQGDGEMTKSPFPK